MPDVIISKSMCVAFNFNSRRPERFRQFWRNVRDFQELILILLVECVLNISGNLLFRRIEQIFYVFRLIRRHFRADAALQLHLRLHNNIVQLCWLPDLRHILRRLHALQGVQNRLIEWACRRVYDSLSPCGDALRQHLPAA